MHLEASQAVIDRDGKTIGRVREVEAGADGEPTGIVVGREGWLPRETRLPVAWIAGVDALGVRLTVAEAEVSVRGSVIVFDDAVLRWLASRRAGEDPPAAGGAGQRTP